MKPKFFSQISDHQQSVAQVPSRGQPHTPTLLVVADFNQPVSYPITEKLLLRLIWRLRWKAPVSMVRPK
jgi:hypothetical protein